MPYLFKDELLDELGTLPLGYIPYGGADFGEVAAVAEAVGDGDSSAFYDAWVAAAERCAAQAGEALHAGRRASARRSICERRAFTARRTGRCSATRWTSG